jgi:hypothetical protein
MWVGMATRLLVLVGLGELVRREPLRGFVGPQRRDRACPRWPHFALRSSFGVPAPTYSVPAGHDLRAGLPLPYQQDTTFGQVCPPNYENDEDDYDYDYD